MKKINIYMKDRTYAQKLSDLLNMKYDDLESILINNIEDYDQSSLLIIDYDNAYIENALKIKEVDKYKNIEHIYKIIVSNYDKLKINNKKEIITFVNLSEMKSENYLSTQIALEYNKSYKTLLVNFNNFHNYNFTSNELGLESLLFVKSAEMEIGVNKSKEVDYISSSQLPLETEKIENTSNILNILKKQNYTKVIIDLCFYISKRNIEILKNSDKIIFHNKVESNYPYALKTIEYIKRNLNHKYVQIYITKSGEEYKLVKNDKTLFTNDIEEMVKFL